MPTCPDVAYAPSFLSKTIESIIYVNKDLLLNWILKHHNMTTEQSLNFPKADQESLIIISYSGSSFYNRPISRSQLGYVIVLADKPGKCSILH